MNNKKKKRERFYLDKFLECIGWNPSNIYDGNDSGQEPDFLIDLNGVKIGVEVTQLFKQHGENGSQDKALEIKHQKFLSDLADSYYKINGTPIHLRILDKIGVIDSNIMDTVTDLAQELFDITKKMEEKERVEEKLSVGLRVDVLRLTNESKYKKYRRWQWIGDHVGFSRQITVKMLEDRVDSKRKKTDKYKSVVERVILLVYADTRYKSGFVHPEDQMTLIVNNGGFEAIYLFLYPKQKPRMVDCAHQKYNAES